VNASISPYVMYPGNAGEPLAFYASILGGTPDTTPYTAFGYADAPEGAIMQGALETPAGLRIFGADDLEAGADPAALPFEQAPWGDHYGQFTDRYGVEWMVNASPAP